MPILRFLPAHNYHALPPHFIVLVRLFGGIVATCIFCLLSLQASTSGKTISCGPGEVAVVIDGLIGGQALVYLDEVGAQKLIRNLAADTAKSDGWMADDEFRFRPIECIILVQGKQTILSDDCLIWIEQTRWRLVSSPFLKDLSAAVTAGLRANTSPYATASELAKHVRLELIKMRLKQDPNSKAHLDRAIRIRVIEGSKN